MEGGIHVRTSIILNGGALEIEEGLEDRVRLLESRKASTLAGSLGIEFVSIHRAELVATMPVDSRTKQPFGILHGGASLALAETLASIGSWVNIDDSQSIA
ncbi:MAG: hotdog fold thioesterase, partial [Deltaproteobacteria bacterium]|nr:hotdog fold thioesterase [Deltaproteobacteria bacterium]